MPQVIGGDPNLNPNVPAPGDIALSESGQGSAMPAAAPPAQSPQLNFDYPGTGQPNPQMGQPLPQAQPQRPPEFQGQHPAAPQWQPQQYTQPQQPIQQPAPQQYAQPQYGQTPQQTQTSTVVRDEMARRNLPVSAYASDDQLLADLGNIINNQQTPSTPAPVAPTQPAAAPAPAAQQDDLVEQWMTMLEVDGETGLYKAIAEGVPAEVIQKANAKRIARQQRAEKLVDDPWAVIKESDDFKTFTDDLKQSWRNEMAAEERTAQSRQQLDQWFAQNDHLLYQRDQNGQQLQDLGGNKMQTPYAQALERNMSTFITQYQQQYGQTPDDLLVLHNAQLGVENEAAKAILAQQQQQQQPGQYQQQAPQQQYQPAQYTNPAAYPVQPQPVQQPQMGALQHAMAQPTNGAMYSNTGAVQGAMQDSITPVNPTLEMSNHFDQASIARGWKISPQWGTA